MIVVEGPDGAGKTTLIQKLSSQWDLPIAPRAVSKDAEAMTDLVKWVQQNVFSAPHNQIFDRHRLISEPIYGPILRRTQRPCFDDLAWMADMVKAFYRAGPLLIYCLPPRDVVRANIQGDPDNAVVSDHIDAIYTAYVARAAMDKAFNPNSVVIYDYTRDNDDLTSLFSHWESLIRYRKEIL